MTDQLEPPHRTSPAIGAPGGPPAPPLADRLLAPFRRFAALEAAGGLVLLACTAVALAWANSPWADATTTCGRRASRSPWAGGRSGRRCTT
jgi:hypothetical protein